MNIEHLRSTIESTIASLLHSVVQLPDELEVIREFEGESLTIWNLRCNAGDRGRIIGKNGDRFQSLRTIAQLIGQRSGHQCKIGELLPSNEPPAIRLPRRFSPDPNWPAGEVTEMARIVASTIFGPTKIELIGIGQSAVIRMVPENPVPIIDRRQAQPALDNLFSAIGTTHGVDLSIDIR